MFDFKGGIPISICDRWLHSGIVGTAATSMLGFEGGMQFRIREIALHIPA
jgi:hypothetical protein